MNITARAIFRPRGDLGQFISSKVTPGVRVGVELAANLVLNEALRIVPVDTGELRDSGHVTVEDTPKSVVGKVIFDANHAAYVEYGTGIAGAASAGAGPFPYDPNWPGMPAQPYLRPAIDSSHDAIVELLRSNVGVNLA